MISFCLILKWIIKQEYEKKKFSHCRLKPVYSRTWVCETQSVWPSAIFPQYDCVAYLVRNHAEPQRHNLIRVFVVHILKETLHTCLSKVHQVKIQIRLQSDLNLRLTHMTEGSFLTLMIYRNYAKHSDDNSLPYLSWSPVYCLLTFLKPARWVVDWLQSFLHFLSFFYHFL